MPDKDKAEKQDAAYYLKRAKDAGWASAATATLGILMTLEYFATLILRGKSGEGAAGEALLIAVMCWGIGIFAFIHLLTSLAQYIAAAREKNNQPGAP